MKITVVNEKDNPLFDRKELELEIDHENAATPSKAELQNSIASDRKAEIECVDIRNIFSDIGISRSKASVFVWKEKKVENLAKAKKEKEAAKEAKPEEKKEASKEEAKEEAKPEAKEEKKEEAKK